MPSTHHDRTPSTHGTREDSVLFALGELARLESDRQHAERRAEEQHREEEERRREREAREREAEARRREELEARARAVAEAEARLRVEAELAQDARMSTLRAELARVQAEREAMHRSVLEASRPSPEGGIASRGWPLAFGLSSVVAAALAGLLVMQAQTPPRVIEVTRPAPVAPVASPVASSSSPASPEVAPAEESAAPAPVASPASPTVASRRVVHPRREATDTAAQTDGRTHSSVRDRAHDEALDFGDDGDDVLGGLERDDTSMSPRRRTR